MKSYLLNLLTTIVVISIVGIVFCGYRKKSEELSVKELTQYLGVTYFFIDFPETKHGYYLVFYLKRKGMEPVIISRSGQGMSTKKHRSPLIISMIKDGMAKFHIEGTSSQFNVVKHLPETLISGQKNSTYPKLIKPKQVFIEYFRSVKIGRNRYRDEIVCGIYYDIIPINSTNKI